MSNPFKKGDKAQAVHRIDYAMAHHGFVKGGTYEVVEDHDEWVRLFSPNRDAFQGVGGWDPGHFELAVPPHPFKAGDRVKCVDAGGSRPEIRHGEFYTIESAPTDPFLGPVVTLSGGLKPAYSDGFFARRFELAPLHQTPLNLAPSSGLDQTKLTRSAVVDVARDAIGELDRRLVLVREHAKSVDADNAALRERVKGLEAANDDLLATKGLQAARIGELEGAAGELDRKLDAAVDDMAKYLEGARQNSSDAFQRGRALAYDFALHVVKRARAA